MKNILIIILLIYKIDSFSQSDAQKRSEREMQTLEKMYNMQKEEEKEEIKSKEQIYKFRNEVSEEINSKMQKITNDEYGNLITLQKSLWSDISNRQKYYNSSTKFLASEYGSLNNFKEKVLNRLSEYINNEKNTEPKATNVVKYEDYDNIIKLYEELKQQNTILVQQNEYLKKNNLDLINNSKEITLLTNKGAENIEKALEKIKEKDLKIKKLSEELNLKVEIINQLKKQLEK